MWTQQSKIYFSNKMITYVTGGLQASAEYNTTSLKSRQIHTELAHSQKKFK